MADTAAFTTQASSRRISCWSARTSIRVQIPGKNGYLGILPGHAPLITELMIGEISYTQGGTTQYLAVAWGFAEVLPDK